MAWSALTVPSSLVSVWPSSVLRKSSVNGLTVGGNTLIQTGQGDSDAVSVTGMTSSGSGTVHPTTGDTFTVSYTIGGASFTQSGHF